MAALRSSADSLPALMVGEAQLICQVATLSSLGTATWANESRSPAQSRWARLLLFPGS